MDGGRADRLTGGPADGLNGPVAAARQAATGIVGRSGVC
jgi:hypothetical protein